MRLLKRPTNPIKLKTKMMSMVLFTILIPFIGLLFFSQIYYKEVIEQKRKDEVITQAQYAAGITMERIESAIKLSKDMTYERKLEEYEMLIRNHKINEALAYNYITEALKNKFYLSKEIIFSAVLLQCNEKQVYSITADGRYRVSDYLKYIHPNIKGYTQDLENKVRFVVHNNNLYIIRNLISTKNFKKYGVLINELDLEYFLQPFINNSHMQEYVNIKIQNEVIELGNSRDLMDQSRGIIDFYGSVESEVCNLSYEIKVSSKRLMAKEIVFIGGVSLGVIGILMIVAWLLFWTYRSIMGPINALTKGLKAIEEGKLGEIIFYDKKDELGFLIKGFNDMSKQIQYLIECVYKEELAVKEAKIKALQSQINPHFINNTLEIINWKAQLIGGKEISKMIRALAVIMNASSSRNNNKMVTLLEEVTYMDSYLYILACRFEERLTIVKEIDEEVLECQVPLLIIQPLLENAVVHGIEPAKGGTIQIKIYREREDVVISIANNGAVLTRSKERYLKAILEGTEKPKRQHGVGLINVHQRIGLIYGEGYGLCISTNAQQMTVSKVVLPYNCTTKSNKAHTCQVKIH